MLNKKLSFLAVGVLCALAPLYSASAAAEEAPSTALIQHAINSGIVPARQFTLDQPGTPKDIVSQQRRTYEQSPLQSTGYWLTTGEVLSINVDYPTNVTAPNLEAVIAVPHDRTIRFSHATKVKLQRGNNTIPVPQDGILYIADYSAAIGGDISVNILSGGKPMPRYILGQNKPSDWTEMLNTYSSVPFAELLSNNMMLTLRQDKAQEYIAAGDVDNMLKSWDKIVNWEEDQYGLTEEGTTSPHRRIAHRFHFVDGIPPAGVTNTDTCAGALNSWVWRMQACSDDATLRVVNLSYLTTGTGWGPWHELGHQFQMSPMTWGGLTEVTVNLSSLYVQRELGLTSNMMNYWDKAVFPYLAQSNRNYDSQSDVMMKLGMFWQLDLTFGKDFYAKLGRVYRNATTLPNNDDEKRQRFILETSKVAGFNLTPFFEKWGLAVSSATQQQLSQLNLPVIDTPIWENMDTNIKYDYSDYVPGETPEPEPDPEPQPDPDDSAYPAWNASTIYSEPCQKVSYNGKDWANGWYIMGVAPSSSDPYGVWREIGSPTMHSQCK